MVGVAGQELYAFLFPQIDSKTLPSEQGLILPEIRFTARADAFA
jgi:hypothetical protein